MQWLPIPTLSTGFLHRTRVPPPHTRLQPPSEMTIAFGHAVVFLPPSSFHRRVVPSRRHRVWKRHRLKAFTASCLSNPPSPPSPFDNLFQSFLSLFPSVNSLNYVAPALGVASGIVLFFTSNSRKLLSSPSTKNNPNSDIGEWILFTSPTPFNRFVTLRCPSICFPENELLEDVNEKLVKEERLYVKLDSGRMIRVGKSEDDAAEKMVYQRICVVAEDGGVLSLDWPANLDLEEERGLDTTVLIIPGTAEGSNERKITAFVCECLRRGIFPVVMNPRGCAGSPLTTARLFTAADSDDISTAVQYISKKRHWTTLMGVGWGYGANMLTKYLAEIGERTPLTAAICIDNPFDLEEFTRSSIHRMDFEQSHLDGFIKILQCNKELFQGQGKGFDVEQALSAPSVRDFEQSISMVSYGYNSIEEFYAKCSTRDLVGKVKIPVLFIQNDDAKVPLFSIPRSSIAENSFTSLLLCSHSPSSNIVDGRLRTSWCQSLTLEWLTAVELGLLKGHHPLLKDVDVTINPSKGLALVERRASEKGRADKLLKDTNGNSLNSPLLKHEENDMGTGIQSRYMEGIEGPPGISKRLQKEHRNVGNQSSASIDAIEEDNGSDNERGQAVQTAQVVMNILDVTMPGVLLDEQKMKVLNAVGQGETLIKALQDAVPEDVRGKLTAAISGIVQSQGSNMKFEFKPDVTSGLNSKFLEKMRLTKSNDDGDVPSLDQKKTIKASEDDSQKFDHNSDKPAGDMDLEKQSSYISQKPIDLDTSQFASDQVSSNPDLEKANLNDMESSENEQLLRGRGSQNSNRERAPTINANEEVSSVSEGPGESNDIVANQEGAGKDGEDQLGSIGENYEHKNDFPLDHHNESEAHDIEDKHSASSPPSEAQGENAAGNSQRKEESAPKSSSSENNSNSPRFSVSEALDALTGFDDSTQAAVNSVFNVIEGVIDQLDVEKDGEHYVGEDDGVDKVEELNEGSVLENSLTKNDSESAKASDLGSNYNAESDESEGSILYDPAGSSYNYDQQNHALSEQISNRSDSNNTRSQMGTDKETSFVPATGVCTAGDFVKYLNSRSQKVPGYSATFPHDDPLYKECCKTYLYWKTRNAEPLDKGRRSMLHLDYISDEGKWKLLEQTEDNIASTGGDGYREDLNGTQQRSKHSDTIVEPTYVILNSSTQQDQSRDSKEADSVNNDIRFDAIESENSLLFIKSIILKCLIVEVGRRVNAVYMKELELKLAGEMEYVANVVSREAGEENVRMHLGSDNLKEKPGTLHGEKIVTAISSALQETQFLKRILPVGVVVGSSLAALRKFFDIAALDGNDDKNLPVEEVGILAERLVEIQEKESSEMLLKEREKHDYPPSSTGEEADNVDLQNSNNQKVMVGAVTAALGASALLVNQQNTETAKTSKEPRSGQESITDLSRLAEIPEKTQNNTVTSLAEKALSVASPVVPLKDDGGVDHERLVAMLAELGQKGGILRLVGKVALLWGGIRGAMSLTDKLITFLRIGERPLFHRILGFVFMVLLLWSPVVLPLLPTLMQSWTVQSPFKIAEFACISGLYVSVLIMITLWGKRIRKYDDPLQQYGLDLASVPMFENYLKGLIGGFILVVSIHAVNSSLGFAHLHWPATLSSSSSEPIVLIKTYAWMLIKVVKGIATATAVSLVEELLFRSWLPEEIAADYGYHLGVVMSGLVFALSQRSMWEIPGIWLLSLSLSGARQRNEGSLSLPIGLRSGMLASSFMLKTGGFLSYQPNLDMWIIGGHPFQPLSGVVGLAFSFVLAVILYPKQALHRKKIRPIRE